MTGKAVQGESGNMSAATLSMQALLSRMDPKGYLNWLEWNMVERVVPLLAYLAWHGYGRVKVVAGRRSLDAERRLFGLGRGELTCRNEGVPVEYSQADAAKVTWCVPESSKHVKGEAVDLTWGGYEETWREVFREGAKIVGLKWGGEWNHVDAGHFEL